MSGIEVTIGNISEHQEAVELHHRFMPITVGNVEWEFSHLEAFAIKVPININHSSTINIDVIILFANHCFTRSIEDGENPPTELIFDNGIERRVLDTERYELSKIHLRSIIHNLPNQTIFYADTKQPNFVIYEIKELFETGKLRNISASEPIYAAARRCFGSWKKAVEAASLEYGKIIKKGRRKASENA